MSSDITALTGTCEVLYNGIALPEVWPPENIDVESTEPMAVPYLDNPPEVINIDIGRQLFVDDFLINKTNLTRSFHQPVKYEGNPILKPESELELDKHGRNLAVACPFSGGIWWDYQENIFKMWYVAGWAGAVCYATSKDGFSWQRPSLDVIKKGTNQVSPLGVHPDSWSVVYDYAAQEAERYKMFIMEPCANARGLCFTSADGLNWSLPVSSGIAGDRTTMFYNPFRDKWCFSLRSGYGWDNLGEEGMRTRHYNEGDTFYESAQWGDVRYPEQRSAVPWAYVDKFDLPDPEIGSKPQLYNIDAVAYESLMLGMFEVHLGPSNEKCCETNTPKIIDLDFAYSRDGFHWSRPDREAAIKSERKEAWDRGYVQSVGGVCSVYKDKLVIYYTGFAGCEDKDKEAGYYDNGATGAAILRRDGFASMDATDNSGFLETCLLKFDGEYLFVNLDAPEGEMKVEIQDAFGKTIEPFSIANCIAVSGDKTLTQVTWKDNPSLKQFKGHPVRLRFELGSGRLYSFWISDSVDGTSGGYLAGGGPDYSSHIDK